jgi:hypothetical protein
MSIDMIINDSLLLIEIDSPEKDTHTSYLNRNRYFNYQKEMYSFKNFYLKIFELF